MVNQNLDHEEFDKCVEFVFEESGRIALSLYKCVEVCHL